MIEIKKCFEIKIASITPKIDTSYEGIKYDPIVGKEYQELYLLPAGNEDEYINETNYKAYGIFQITLKYPLLKYKDMLDRVKLYLDTFPRAITMTNNNIKVKVKNTPIVRNLGQDSDRLVYVISINYEAFYE
jgi:hypothetical protein